MIMQMTSAPVEREIEQQVITFLRGRLEEYESVEWALALPSPDCAEASAILRMLQFPDSVKLKEPWKTAWRLIEEAWREENFKRFESDDQLFRVTQLVNSGDESGVLISNIVKLVRPYLHVEAIKNYEKLIRSIPEKPKKWTQVLRASLASGKVVDPKKIGIEKLKSVEVLNELAAKLEASIQHGLGIAHRLGWGARTRFWRLGQLNRVFYDTRAEEEHEADEFHRGISPSVKLLFSVFERLLELAPKDALAISELWRHSTSEIHQRLWGAASRDKRVSTAEEIADFQIALVADQFWDTGGHPEFSELRAVRFVEMNSRDQKRILTKIMRGPSRSFWPRKIDDDQFAIARQHMVSRELRRIRAGGAELDGEYEVLANEDPALNVWGEIDEGGITEGFTGSSKARWIPPNPDNSFDSLSGVQRLETLQSALISARVNWNNNPSERALDWVRSGRNVDLIQSDFESAEALDSYPNVWEAFGWSHKPLNNPEKDAELGSRAIALIKKLSDATISGAIDGLSHWLGTWEKISIATDQKYDLWRKLWPLAVAATNAQQPEQEEPRLDVIVKSDSRYEQQNLDTLNTPAGRLVGAFLAFLPAVVNGRKPFDEDQQLRDIRDAIVSASGRAKLIALHRMIEGLQYFLIADEVWARKNLVDPLLEDTGSATKLWQAVGLGLRPRGVVKILGSAMVSRATDLRLGRDTRKALSWNVLVDVLHAFLQKAAPAVSEHDVQQMLRSVEDEVRSHTAGALGRFIQEMSRGQRDGARAPEYLFRNAVLPVLDRVWPQERVEATPGVSKELADLPVVCGSAFAEAVDAIERFLVPFDCWSMLEYGLFGDFEGRPKLSLISQKTDAQAFLRLLDATIDSVEGAVIPFDLGDALAQIASVDPGLSETRAFRRLATLGRR